MAQASVQLIVDAAKAVNPLRKVQRESKKVEGAVRDMNGKLKDSKGRFVAMGREANNASKKINGFGKALKQAIAAAAVFQAAKFVLVKTAQLETQTKSLQVLTGSLNDAKSIIEELQAFGAVTPFTSAELIETAKRLKAFGFETNQIVDVTKRLGDVAGATGADLGGIATAFGQIQAKGRLQGEELLQLQERGVNLQAELQKMYGMTGEEFRKSLEKGRFSAEAVNLALVRLTEQGGKYADGAIAQSDTLAGKFSTIQDGIGRLATEVGTRLEPAIKFVLDLAIQAVGEITTLLGKGAEARNFGMTQKQLDAIDRRASETATTIGRLRGYMGPLDPRQALLQSQIARDMMRQYGYETGQLQLPAAETTTARPVPKLLGGGNGDGNGSGGGGKIVADRVNAGAAILLQQERTLELMRQDTDLQRQLLQIQYDKQDAAARIRETTAAKQQEELLANNSLIASNRENALIMDYVFEQTANAVKKTTDLVEARKKAQADFKQFFKTEMEKEGEAVKQLFKSIGDAISTSVVDALTGAIQGTQKLADIAINLLSTIGRMLVQFGLNQALGSVPFLQPLFGRANGGPVQGGRPYIVGERGPELFMPSQSGQISSNEDMRRLMGRSPVGGAAQMNFTFETTNIGGTEYVSREQLELAMATTRRQAANDGAQRGMSMTLDRMQNSPRTRSRLGIA